MQYDDPMPRPGFDTYVFVERIAANAAALHPFPEHHVGLVREALADAGLEVSVLGPGAPEVGEAVYFQSEPMDDDALGLLADALTLRGIGAYAYALVGDSIGDGLGSIALFTRVGDVFPRAGRRILMTRMWISRSPVRKAVTWAFGSPADLDEANLLLSERFETEPVLDPRGMAAIVRAAQAGRDLTGLRVGVISELDGGEGYDPGVLDSFHAALGLLEAAGASVETISLPHLEYALDAYYLIMPAEVSSNLARYDGMRYGLRVEPASGPVTAETVMAATRGAGFGDEAKRRIILGTHVLSAGYYDAYYGSAQKVRTLVQRDFAAAWERADVLVSPTAPITAYRFGEKDDPLAMYKLDVTTIPANLAGIPGMSLPSGLSGGLPVGFQILAPQRADDRLYRVGAVLEAALEETWGGHLLAQAPELEEEQR